ncbi:MAG: putative metal-binding motif-containing protein [Nanoarchaeota archaeon]|nr:putative metal-binding motif-containing protein [Nanoarchaeota archaeon]
MKKILILLTFVIMATSVYAYGPIPNSDFETGNLDNWETFCGGTPLPGACTNAIAEVGAAYARYGNYGLKLSNSPAYHWSYSYIKPVDRFDDDYDIYDIPMKLTAMGGYYSFIRVLIRDSKGYVEYRGTNRRNVHGSPPSKHFVMVLNKWKDYRFNFDYDYYNKYHRRPDTNRTILIGAKQDYWSGGSTVYIDNIFGDAKPPCTDNDGDGYNSGGIGCGAVDCNDNDATIHPGALEICDGIDNDCNPETFDGSVESWYNQPTFCGVGECAESGLYTCQNGQQYDTCIPGTPVPESCDGLDNDCNGIVDNVDADNDELNDCNEDLCLGSVSDSIELKPNQYAQNLDFGRFESGPNNDQSIVYDMQTTKGCTCKQIAENLDAGDGHVKKGCSPSLMEEWTGLNANPDRKEKIGNKITGNFISSITEISFPGLLFASSIIAILVVITIGTYKK